jgi:hypothetical protein
MLKALKKLERSGILDRDWQAAPVSTSVEDSPADAAVPRHVPAQTATSAVPNEFPNNDDRSGSDGFDDENEDIPATDSAAWYESQQPLSQWDNPRESAFDVIDQLEAAARSAAGDLNTTVPCSFPPVGRSADLIEPPIRGPGQAADLANDFRQPPTAEAVAGPSDLEQADIDRLSAEYTPFYQPVIEPMLEVESAGFEDDEFYSEPFGPAPIDSERSAGIDQNAGLPEPAGTPLYGSETGPGVGLPDQGDSLWDDPQPAITAAGPAGSQDNTVDGLDDEFRQLFPRSLVAAPTDFERAILERLSNDRYERVFDLLQQEIARRTGDQPSLAVTILAPRSTPETANLVAHLAITTASKGQSDVLMVDANMGDRHLSTQFDQGFATGFLELCVDPTDLTSLLHQTSVQRLHLLACGDFGHNGPGPTEIPTAFIPDLVDSFRQQFRWVFIDGGSLDSPTAKQLIEHTQATVLLITLGQTLRSETAAAIREIDKMNGNLIGCVVAGAYKS